MTPLQKVAMGLVIVFLRAPFGGFDALVDPVGWGLVLAGLLPVRSRLPQGGTAVTLATFAALVSVPLVVPAVNEQLTPSGQWALSVPQSVFCIVVCGALATLAERAGDREARRFGLLRVAYVAVLAGPVLVYGGQVDVLATPVAVLAVLSNVYLVYLTFKVSKRDYAQGTDRPDGTEAAPPGGTASV